MLLEMYFFSHYSFSFKQHHRAEQKEKLSAFVFFLILPFSIFFYKFLCKKLHKIWVLFFAFVNNECELFGLNSLLFLCGPIRFSSLRGSVSVRLVSVSPGRADTSPSSTRRLFCLTQLFSGCPSWCPPSSTLPPLCEGRLLIQLDKYFPQFWHQSGLKAVTHWHVCWQGPFAFWRTLTHQRCICVLEKPSHVLVCNNTAPWYYY